MFTVYPSSRITIGDNSGISSACLWASTSITIGNYVKIGGDCVIMDSSTSFRRPAVQRATGFGSSTWTTQ